MARIIKFRAWDKEAKRYLSQKEMTDIGGFYYNYGVDPDKDEFVLEQYMNLKDKNGVEIFEGDMLEYATIWGGVASPERVGERVVHHCATAELETFYFSDYEDSCAGFGWKIDSCDLEAIEKHWEVVGNIHKPNAQAAPPPKTLL